MREPVLTKPTGAGAGEHGPAGPGAPAGRQGEGRRRWRAPSDRAGALSTSERSPPARRSGAARKKAHARPVRRARSARARLFLPGEEVRWCGRAGRPLLPVVRGGFGNEVGRCQNSQCRTSRLGAPRGEPVLPQWNTRPFLRPLTFHGARRPRFPRMLGTSERTSELSELSVLPVTHQAQEVAGVRVEKMASRKKV